MRSPLHGVTAKIAVAILVVIAILAVFGHVIAPQNPLAQHLSAINSAPSWAHWLGTDGLGRDVFSRLISGSPLSVLGALEAVAIGIVLGALPGVLSVYLGPVFEWISLRLMDSLLTLPFLVFAIAMCALLGNGLTQAMLAVGILIAPGFYRVTRAAAVSVARSPYVEAAELLGASTAWVVRKHLAGKVLPAVGIVTANLTGASLMVASALTFLGIGVIPPAPTWGGLLATDLNDLYRQPYGPIAPLLIIALTVWALNALADALQDSTTLATQPTTRRRLWKASPRPATEAGHATV